MKETTGKVHIPKLRLPGLVGIIFFALNACGEGVWNNPYPAGDDEKNILYSSFESRPKHLDPVRSYSANEYGLIGNIYEPPLQYHYLKRPYTLVPLTATEVPKAVYVDESGKRLPADAPIETIAYSLYEIPIQPGILYQPHPALAKDTQGRYRYHHLDLKDLAGIHTLSDFEHAGTRELVAEDYVYQIKRMAHPRYNSPIFGLMTEYIDGLAAYGKTLQAAYEEVSQEEGFKGWLDLRQHDFPGVEVIDRHRYRIKIKGKYPQFKFWLAMPFFAPMPWEAERFHAQPGMKDKNLTLHWYPIGTGPYMLTVNNPNLRMIMERNPNFHGESYPNEGMPGDLENGLLTDANKSLPFIEKVVTSLEKESIPRWNKFLQGYYDVSGIASDTFDQAVQVGTGGELTLTDEMQSKGIRLSTAVDASTFYFGFNMLDAVVGHPAGDRGRYLRQAIAIAVDYEEFISIFTNGRGIAAQGPLPPGIFGYRRGEAGINPIVYQWKNNRPVRRSLTEAKVLLTKAGFPNGRNVQTGEPLKLYFDTTASGPDDKARLSWWRKQFAKLNIELIIRPTDYNRFQDKMFKGTAQMYQWGWNADYPDPENFLFLLYGPNGKVQFKGENASNYQNEEFDRLYDEMKNMDNTPRRQAIVDRMLTILREDSPWLWGIHPKSFALFHDWYFNSKPNLMANNTLKYKRIDPHLRMEKRRGWNQPVTWPLWGGAAVFIITVLPAVVSFRRRQRARPQPTEVIE